MYRVPSGPAILTAANPQQARYPASGREFGPPPAVVAAIQNHPESHHTQQHDLRPSGSMLVVDNYHSDPPYSDDGVAFDGDRPVGLSMIAHGINQDNSRATVPRPGRLQRPWRPRER